MRMTELYAIDEKTTIGTYVFDAESIIRFATRFDPQPFHVDVEAARQSLFGGLCASGWHTCAAWMKTFVAYWTAESEKLRRDGLTPPKLGPSPGFRDLKWLKPVFAGDTVTYFVTLLDGRALASKPGRRMNTILCEGINQQGEAVIRFESAVLEFE